MSFANRDSLISTQSAGPVPEGGLELSAVVAAAGPEGRAEHRLIAEGHVGATNGPLGPESFFRPQHAKANWALPCRFLCRLYAWMTLPSIMVLAYLINRFLGDRPEQGDEAMQLEWAMAFIPFFFGLLWCAIATAREAYKVPPSAELSKHLFLLIAERFSVSPQTIQRIQRIPEADLVGKVSLDELRAVETKHSLCKMVVEERALRYSIVSLFGGYLALMPLIYEVLADIAVDMKLLSTEARRAEIPIWMYPVPLAFISITFGCAWVGWRSKQAARQQHAAPIQENWVDLPNMLDRTFQRLSEETKRLLALPRDLAFWKQVKRLDEASGVFAKPDRPIGPATSPGLLKSYTDAFNSGQLTVGLFGQQLSLGFNLGAGPQSRCKRICTLLVYFFGPILLVMPWCGLPFYFAPRLEESSEYVSSESMDSLGAMLYLSWVATGAPFMFLTFYMVPRRLGSFCEAIISSHKALTTSLADPDLAASQGLPPIDIQEYRELAMWRSSRELLTLSSARTLAEMQFELAVVVVGLLLSMLSIFGAAFLAGGWTLSILNGNAIICTLICIPELLPALLKGAELNSVLAEQVDVIRRHTHEVAFRETVVAASPRPDLQELDKLARARTYLQCMLTDLERPKEAFLLFGVKLDFKLLAGIATPAVTSLVLQSWKAFNVYIQQRATATATTTTTTTTTTAAPAALLEAALAMLSG